MSDLNQKEETNPTGNIPNGIFGQYGWICPKCGRVYSPFTHMCLYCRNEKDLPEGIVKLRKKKELKGQLK